MKTYMTEMTCISEREFFPSYGNIALDKKAANSQLIHINAREAYEILKEEREAMLVDVRTLAEWSFVGMPSLKELKKNVLTISWRLYPSMQVNPHFETQLMEEIPNRYTPLLFICRGGIRSEEAAKAMMAQGYTRCYRLSDGFEGPLDNSGHRGRISGWKAEHLPWEQA